MLFLPTDAPRRPTFTAQLDPDATGVAARRQGLLLCRVDSNPPAQMRLLHKDHVVASSLALGCGGCSRRLKVTRAPNLLRVEIGSPVLEDEGVYLCEASNALGNTSVSANFDARGESAQGMGSSGSGAVRGTLSPPPTPRQGGSIR